MSVRAATLMEAEVENGGGGADAARGLVGFGGSGTDGGDGTDVAGMLVVFDGSGAGGGAGTDAAPSGAS